MSSAPAMLPANLDPSIFERAYLGAAGPFTPKLLSHYFAHVCPPSAALMVQGLKHSSKPVRAAAVMAASNLGGSLALLLPLLKERKKSTRLAIGQALYVASTELVLPHRPHLEAALKTEKVGEVQETLRSALARL